MMTPRIRGIILSSEKSFWRIDVQFSSVRTSLVAQRLKHLPAMWETWVRSLGQEDPLEKEMANHSSILAWRIPWTKDPGRLQSTGSQRVGHDWATSLSLSLSFSSAQSLSPVWLFATPWTAARQASLSITNSRSSLKLTSIESLMPSSHLILCRPLLLLPTIPPSIRVFSNESTLRMKWPKYWSFSFSIVPSKEHPGLISFRMDWLDLLAVQKHQFFGTQLSSQSNSHIHTWPLEKT